MLAIAMGGLIITSCDQGVPDADRIQSEKQAASLREADAQIGMPAIKNFQERKLMKMILELRDQANLVCYAYVVPELTGKPIFIGKCIGYGIPYATQFTNPEVMVYRTSGHQPMPQADPNGLFMPASAEGTWVMLINPETNEPSPTYIEPRIIISQFPLGSK